MRWRLTLGGGLVALSLSSPVALAEVPVIDTAGIAQLVLQLKQQMQSYAEQIRQTANQVEQLRNQVTQIEYAYTQVEQGIRNLQSFNRNYASGLLGLSQAIDGKLRQAESIGYQASTAWSQAQGLYPKMLHVLPVQEVMRFQRQWTDTQRQAAQVAVQVEAIQDQQKETMQRITDLMTRASQSQGNLDTQQALAQGQGLVAGQLVNIEAQLAVQSRLHSLQILQESAMTEGAMNALEAASQHVDPGTPAQGRLLRLSR